MTKKLKWRKKQTPILFRCFCLCCFFFCLSHFCVIKCHVSISNKQRPKREKRLYHLISCLLLLVIGTKIIRCDGKKQQKKKNVSFNTLSTQRTEPRAYMFSLFISFYSSNRMAITAFWCHKFFFHIQRKRTTNKLDFLMIKTRKVEEYK